MCVFLLLLSLFLSPLQQLGIHGAVVASQQRDGTPHSTLQRNEGNTDFVSTLTLQDGIIQDSGQVHTFKLHESQDESTIPNASNMQFPREVIYQRHSHKEDLPKLPENIHFHHKIGRIKHKIHYDENSSEDAKSSFLGEKETNKSADYILGDTNFKLSSDYDADVEDINVEEGERNCVSVLCDLFDTNCENSNGKDLSKFMESLISDRHNKFASDNRSPGKHSYTSKKFSKILESENAKNNAISKHRHKRASFIIPQLAVVIPMMDHKEYGDGDEDISKKLKRCITKSCHTGLCHKMGCYEDSAQEPLIGESYENEYNSPIYTKKLFSQSNDPTLFNHNTNPNAYLDGNILPIHKIPPWHRVENKPIHPKKLFSESNDPTLFNHNTNTNAHLHGNIFPIHKIPPWQRAENKPKNYMLRTKSHEIPQHLKERKHEPTALLNEKQLTGRLNDDEDDSSESSEDKHLHACAERLKEWINMHWENKRNPMQSRHLDLHKQVGPLKHQQHEKSRANFQEQLEIPTNFEYTLQNSTNEKDDGSLLQPNNKVNFNKSYANDHLSLPREQEVRVTLNIPQVNKSSIANESNWLPVPYKTISSHSTEKQQKHENKGRRPEDNESNMTKLNLTNNVRNSKLYSLFHTNTTQLHHTPPDNLKSQHVASDYLPKQPPQESILYNKEIKPHSSARSDSQSSDKRFVSSGEDDELLYPVKGIKKFGPSNTQLNTQHLGQTVNQFTPKEQVNPLGTWLHAGQNPVQLAQKKHYSQHSGVLQQVNLQEIYKNLPRDFELSAGQWIHLKPMERNRVTSWGINNRPITEKPKKQYNKGMQDFPGYKYRHTLDEPQKSSDNIVREFIKIPESITTMLPNEINTITDGFSKTTIDYLSESDIKYAPSEEKRKPANIEDNGKNINTNVYLPQERNIPINITNDNQIMTIEQFTGTQLLPNKKNYTKPKNTSQDAITTGISKEFNTISDGFQKRIVGASDRKNDHKSGGHIEYTPSEEKRKPESMDDRKNINTHVYLSEGRNVYLPDRRNIPTQLTNDNLIITTQQSIGEQLSMVNNNNNNNKAKNASQYIIGEIISSLKMPNGKSLPETTSSLKNEEKKFNHSLSSTDPQKTLEQLNKTPSPILSATNDINIDKNQLSNLEFLTHLQSDENRYRNELSTEENFATTDSKNEDKNTSFRLKLQNRESHEDDLHTSTFKTPLFNKQNISNVITESQTKDYISEEDEHSTSNKIQKTDGPDFSKSKKEMNLEDYVNIEKMNPAGIPPHSNTMERSSSTSLVRLNIGDNNQNVTKELLPEKPSENRTNYEFAKFTPDTKTNPRQETSQNDTSDGISSALKTSGQEPNIQATTVYYSTDAAFKNESDGRLDYSQNKKFSNLRSSSSEITADKTLQNTEKDEEREGGGGRDDHQPYSKSIVYPFEDSKSMELSYSGASSATLAPPMEEGVSGKKMTQQNGFEEKTYMQTDPEEGNQTYYIWAKEDRGIPLTSYPTDQGSSKSELFETKSVETISHITGRYSTPSTENHMKKSHNKIPLLENIFEEKERVSSGYKTQIPNLQPNIYQEPSPTKERTSEYSGTLFIVDPTTGAVTEAIPVIGRVLTGRHQEGEEINELYQDAVPSSHQPSTFSYLETNSPIKYSEVKARNMAKLDDNMQTLAQDIPKPSQFSIEIFDPTPRVHSEQYTLPEFESSKTSDSSTQTETIVNMSQIEEDNRISPSPLRMSLESSVSSSLTDDAVQTNTDIQVKLPDLNITCLPHAKDPPCDLAQNDVYRNFFTVMLNEMQRVGKENCSQNCTGTKIVPACEQCIKNLINRKINDQSMDEEVTDFANIHCPQQEETDNTKNIDFVEQSSSAPYTKCKYKFIADLTSLFGLWLKAITNSR